MTVLVIILIFALALLGIRSYFAVKRLERLEGLVGKEILPTMRELSAVLVKLAALAEPADEGDQFTEIKDDDEVSNHGDEPM